MAPLNEGETSAANENVEIVNEIEAERHAALEALYPNRADALLALKDKLAAGKRDLATGALTDAVPKLADAAELCEFLGDDATADDRFAANYEYGAVLLELASMENDVLTHAVGQTNVAAKVSVETKDGDKANESATSAMDDSVVGDPDEMTAEEREQVREQVSEALTEDGEKTDKTAETPAQEDASKPEEDASKPEGDAKKPEDDASKPKEDAKKPEDDASKSEEDANKPEGDASKTAENGGDKDGEGAEDEDEEEEGEGEDGDDDDDEPESESNVQLAWEVFEIARALCDKELDRLSATENPDEAEKRRWLLRKSQTLCSLADCSCVDNKYQQATTDLATALEINHAVFGETPTTLAGWREQAAVLTSLGRVHRLADDFLAAAEAYEKGRDALKRAIEIGGDEKAIDELKSIVPELEEKLDDARQSHEMYKKVKSMLSAELAPLKQLVSAGDTNDVSNMVRKKRPATEDAKTAAAESETSDGPEPKKKPPTTVDSDVAPDAENEKPVEQDA